MSTYIKAKKEKAMTDLSREILEKYQIRKSKAQKQKFRELILSEIDSLGYKVKVEKNGKADNVVVGNPVTASVIYTAHYDTPARMPFPNLMIPKSAPLFILYQLAASLLIYSIPILIMFFGSTVVYNRTGSDTLMTLTMLFGYSLIFVFSWLLLAGPENKHNANDNTSGVITLLEIMRALPEEQRAKVAFVFFDLEELGCVGSKLFAKAHKNAIKSTPVINFDCVGYGSTIFIAPRKDARDLKDKLEAAFAKNESFATEVALKSTFSNSDHRNFPVGVGVAAFKTSKSGILYNDRIHTKHDTICNEQNIDFVARCAVKLAEKYELGKNASSSSSGRG